jgi:predicted nucleotidyltransferase
MVSEGEIQEFADKVAREFHPERIILFGSYAWGQPDAESDDDLLVLVRGVESPVRLATEITYQLRPSFPVDLIVRDPDEVAERIQHQDWFLTRILRDGKVLHESAYA